MGVHMTPGLRVALTVASIAVTVVSCDVGPVEPVGRRTSRVLQGGGGAPITTTIEGTWRRTLVFFDDFGFMHSSETTWTFEPGGTAARTIVATNITLGASDTILTTARWRVDGGNVVIDFIAPSPGTITLTVFVQGTSLFLAGQEYLRVP